MQKQSSSESRRLTIRLATDADRETLYSLRYEVYAEELSQHPINVDELLSDSLDAFNVYVVACIEAEIIGFISVTPPGHAQYSVDKYITRDQLPFPVDDGLYELRILTVKPAFRKSPAAFLLMYAATVWAYMHQGTRIMAIGRMEIKDMYCKVGLEPHGIEIRAGAVTFELMSASVASIRKFWSRKASLIRKFEAGVDWQMEGPFFSDAYLTDQTDACFHGGAFFDYVGAEFNTLERSVEVINADVLDAWFPPSPNVISALQEYLPWLIRTSPPTFSEGLTHVLAQTRKVPENTLLPGAGSSSLIFLALRHWLTPESRALIFEPSYGEYAHVLERVIGCRVDRFLLERQNNYLPDLEQFAERVKTGYDLVIIVNPNSPTGQYVSGGDLAQILRQASASIRFWIDETYLEYAEAGQSLESLAAESSNVIVCKSLSKILALSGLRVAYLCGSPEIMASLRRISPPWSVGLLAQLAVIRALQDPAYYMARYEETRRFREIMRSGLLHLGMPQVIPGCANFLLCHLPSEGKDTETLLQACQKDNLFLRNPAITSPSLGRHALRIAIKDSATNIKMLGILERALQG